MNLSGKAVSYWLQQEKLDKQQVLVVLDDLSLELGKLRIRPKGSDAGHNGLKNIAEVLGTVDYPRLKVGIGNNFPKGRQVEFVLGRWTEEEQATINLSKDVAISMIKQYVFDQKPTSGSVD